MDRRLKHLLDLLDGVGRTREHLGAIAGAVARRGAVAAEMGLASSTTELTVRGLRDTLEALAQRAVLDAHYRAHPEVRPSLAEWPWRAAELDGNPLAGRPELIRRAARRSWPSKTTRT